VLVFGLNEKDWATVRAITYRHNGGTAGGLLVVPKGEGPFPLLVYAPGSDTPADMWLDSAVALAKHSYAGFLLEESGGPFWTFDAAQDGRAFVNWTTDARRGLDLLQTMPTIDTTHIGFVAWSNGGRLGSFLSGVDDRIKAYVFVGLNNEDVTTWSAKDQQDIKARGVSLEGYAAAMSIFDPAVYFFRNKDAHFLFIWGKDELDPFVLKWYRAGAPKLSTMRVFAGSHEVTNEEQAYLQAWILKNL
jgi:hypothetical protein